MKNNMFMRMFTLIFVCALIVATSAGCENASAPIANKGSEVSAPTKGSVENNEKESAKFNPDTEKNTISYDALEERFGPLQDLKLPAGVSVGGILKNQANEFWLALGEGMKNNAKANNVSIDIQATRTETDTAGQLSIMETMLQNKYDCLILSPLTNECLDSAVATAKKDGIPIVNANCEYINEADVFVGGLQIEIGRKAADYIASKINGKGKAAIIEGVPGTFTSIQRVNGFNERIANYPDIEVVASIPADYETEKGMNAATDIITANNDISAIYCCNDNMALGAVEALRNADMLGKVVIIGVDGTGDAYKSIHAGELNATVDQFPEMSGEVTLEVALRLTGGQDIPRVVSTPIEVVDISNAAEFNK